MLKVVDVLIVVGALRELLLLLLDFLVVGTEDEGFVVGVEPMLVGGSVIMTVPIVRVMVIVF